MSKQHKDKTPYTANEKQGSQQDKSQQGSQNKKHEQQQG